MGQTQRLIGDVFGTKTGINAVALNTTDSGLPCVSEASMQQ
jgi:hypothetical protein